MVHPTILEELSLTQPLLIYIPAFNCCDTILRVIEGLPPGSEAFSEVLVIDNCSADGTLAAVRTACETGSMRHRIHVVQPFRNVGYAGSQKLAYSIACHSPALRWVAMVHGDGQYPPQLLTSFIDRMSSPHGTVYGYRSKWHYPRHEETPLITWLAIRVLSMAESAMTGVNRHEWHSGFAMHSTRFLKKLDLTALTDTPHIDGHLLFAADIVNESVIGIPIYKLYKELTAFEGAARRRYVLDVLKLMFAFKRTRDRIPRGERPICSPEDLAGGPVRLCRL